MTAGVKTPAIFIFSVSGGTGESCESVEVSGIKELYLDKKHICAYTVYIDINGICTEEG